MSVQTNLLLKTSCIRFTCKRTIWIGWSLVEKRNIYFSSQYLLEFPMGALFRSNRNLWKPLYSSNWIRMSPIQSKCNNSPAPYKAILHYCGFLNFPSIHKSVFIGQLLHVETWHQTITNFNGSIPQKLLISHKTQTILM